MHQSMLIPEIHGNQVDFELADQSVGPDGVVIHHFDAQLLQLELSRGIDLLVKEHVLTPIRHTTALVVLGLRVLTQIEAFHLYQRVHCAANY